MTRVRTSGFTLIELLVVVSVIALLSSLMLASIVEARKKAYNAKVLQEVHQYVIALQMAKDEYGQFPDPTEAPDAGSLNVDYCLGDDYPSNSCGNNGSALSENGSVNGPLEEYISGLPSDTTQVRFDGFYLTGYLYRCESKTNGKCNQIQLTWTLKGENKECGRHGTPISGMSNATYCTGDIE